MKRFVPLLIAVLMVVSVSGAFAQTTDDIASLDTFKSAFTNFSDEFARSLPMNSMIGLNWSDAYIGQLLPIPSFGVGITSGFTTIPASVFTDLTSDLGITVGGGIGDLPSVGIPLPGYALDARLGGLVIPFDVGLKFGTIGSLELGDVEAEYTNFGIDFRYAVLDGGILPKVSVGLGYNRLSGRVATPLGLGTTTIGSVPYPGGTGEAEVLLSDPKLDVDWTANVIDLKAQVSKSFLIIEPHFGLGAAFGSAETNAGLKSTVSATDSVSGTPVDLATLESLSGISLSEQGVSLGSDVSTFSLRAFGGASLNLALLRFDLGVMYNLTSGSLGGTLGARIQL
jgi:hypothetical protein